MMVSHPKMNGEGWIRAMAQFMYPAEDRPKINWSCSDILDMDTALAVVVVKMSHPVGQSCNYSSY